LARRGLRPRRMEARSVLALLAKSRGWPKASLPRGQRRRSRAGARLAAPGLSCWSEWRKEGLPVQAGGLIMSGRPRPRLLKALAPSAPLAPASPRRTRGWRRSPLTVKKGGPRRPWADGVLGWFWVFRGCYCRFKTASASKPVGLARAARGGDRAREPKLAGPPFWGLWEPQL
jgi:hypothetical protein